MLPAAPVQETLPWALDAIRALGVAGGPVFAVLWWMERQERKTCQKESKELTVQVVTLTGATATGLDSVTEAVKELGEGTKESVKTLSSLIRSMRRAA